MTGVPKIRGKINVVLNGLVQAGVIRGFRTAFDVPHGASGPVVTISVPHGRSPEDARMAVVDALLAVAIGIDVTAESDRDALTGR